MKTLYHDTSAFTPRLCKVQPGEVFLCPDCEQEAPKAKWRNKCESCASKYNTRAARKTEAKLKILDPMRGRKTHGWDATKANELLRMKL